MTKTEKTTAEKVASILALVAFGLKCVELGILIAAKKEGRAK